MVFKHKTRVLVLKNDNSCLFFLRGSSSLFSPLKLMTWKAYHRLHQIRFPSFTRVLFKLKCAKVLQELSSVCLLNKKRCRRGHKRVKRQLPIRLKTFGQTAGFPHLTGIKSQIITILTISHFRGGLVNFSSQEKDNCFPKTYNCDRHFALPSKDYYHHQSPQDVFFDSLPGSLLLCHCLCQRTSWWVSSHSLTVISLVLQYFDAAVFYRWDNTVSTMTCHFLFKRIHRNHFCNTFANAFSLCNLFLFTPFFSIL